MQPQSPPSSIDGTVLKGSDEFVDEGVAARGVTVNLLSPRATPRSAAPVFWTHSFTIYSA